jgi:hypothetical protein
MRSFIVKLNDIQFCQKDISHFLIRETQGCLYIRAYTVLWLIDLLLGKELKQTKKQHLL